MEQTRDQILEEARKILKTHEIDINRKGWATFWCPNPAHNDAARTGKTGEPNFGVDLNTGRYHCFVCHFSGGSLYILAKKLGSDYKPQQVTEYIRKKPKRELTEGKTVADVSEALADAQSRILSSSAMSYLKHRGVTPYTAMMYGLGYGIGNPAVSYPTTDAGYKLGMVYRREWLWAESIVYADPVTDPVVLNVRYLPPEYMGQERGFKLGKHPHRTWGDRLAPLGAWRITECTKAIIVVEGLFDMLVGAQFLDQQGLFPDIACVYTNGASPSAEIVEWFGEHDYDYFLIQDMDKGGDDWAATLTRVMNEKGFKYTLIYPPDNKDPDEAFLSGWWPPCI
jgi:DNA primase